MKNISYSLLIILFFAAISSCRPSYMRCPKNRRCVEVIPKEATKEITAAIIKVTSKEKNS